MSYPTLPPEMPDLQCTNSLPVYRTGIVPLDFARDIGGPIGRTVQDVAKLFTYIVGPDPTDPLTSLSNDAGAVPAGGYEQFLMPGSLKVGLLSH